MVFRKLSVGLRLKLFKMLGCIKSGCCDETFVQAKTARLRDNLNLRKLPSSSSIFIYFFAENSLTSRPTRTQEKATREKRLRIPG